jgi:hypothetical protein
MALYGAPVWVDALSPQNRAILKRPQRIIANRAIRAYRTVGFEAATALAGTLPWDLEAAVLRDVYCRRTDIRCRGGRPAPDEVEGWRREARETAIEAWALRLANPSAGHWTITGLQPVLLEWLKRRFGTLTFRMVQLLTGHGCFGRYLHRIARREETGRCHECGASEDTAEHTLQVCSSFAVERQVLCAVIGVDLTMPAILRAMVGDRTGWDAVATFAETVMARKEAAERLREEDPLAVAMRRRRGGRRRRVYNQTLP